MVKEIRLEKGSNKGGNMFGAGMPESTVILVIALIIYDAGKLPQIGENLGKAIRNIKSSNQEKKEFPQVIDDNYKNK